MNIFRIAVGITNLHLLECMVCMYFYHSSFVTLLMERSVHVARSQNRYINHGVENLWPLTMHKYTHNLYKYSMQWHARWHNINIHCYLCRDSCVKCSNVVECALLVCVLCQPIPPSSTHPYNFGQFLLKIFKISLQIVYNLADSARTQLIHTQSVTGKRTIAWGDLYIIHIKFKWGIKNYTCSNQASYSYFYFN